MNYYEDWKHFLTILPELKTKVEPLAKRSGLSADEALYLVLLMDFSDYNINISEELKESLISRHFAEYNCGSVKLTGRGAILAKSFIMAMEK